MLQITMNFNSFLNKLQRPQMSLPQLQFPHQSDLPSQFDPTSSHDDFLDQILSPIPPSFPWDPSAVDDQSLILSRENDASVQALFNVFAGSVGQISDQTTQSFRHPDQCQNLVPPPTVSGPGGGGVVGQPKQRTRAKRGQATDPHSIAERGENFGENEGFAGASTNANKTDKASMLDEIIDYVKFLQLQVKVLSMSRLGGATSVSQAHLLPDAHSQGRSNTGKQTMPSLNNNNSNDNVRVTENHVTKLLQEDMGSALQYLQGKGLCLMPISLATAISTAKCHSKTPLASINYTDNDALVNGDESCVASPPSMSALTVQSTTIGNFTGQESSRKSE